MTEQTKASKFILPVGYSVPSTTSVDYLKLQASNRIRILTPILPINRWWGVDGIYYSNSRKCPVHIDKLKLNPKTKQPGELQHTWVFGCWDLLSESFKLAEIYQRSILTGMIGLINSDDQGWGDPTLYNISITKSQSSGNFASYTVSGLPGGYGKPPTDQMIEAAGEAWTDPNRWLVSNLMGEYKDLDPDDSIILNAIYNIDCYFAGDRSASLNFFKPSGSKDDKSDETSSTPETMAPEKTAPEKEEWKQFAEDYHNNVRDEFIPGGGDDLINKFIQVAFNYYALQLTGTPKDTMIRLMKNLGYESSAQCTKDDVNRVCAMIKGSDIDF